MRTLRVVGAALALIGRQRAMGINLLLESSQERLASGPGADDVDVWSQEILD